MLNGNMPDLFKDQLKKQIDEEKAGLLADLLNAQLVQQELILEAAGVEFDKAAKFDGQMISGIIQDQSFEDAFSIIATAFNDEQKKLQRQIALELGVSNEKIEEIFD